MQRIALFHAECNGQLNRLWTSHSVVIMTFPRAAGVLLHPTSLPSPNGVGDIGTASLRFLDVMAASGVRIWQMLPLGPTGYGDSPYQCFSAFAGNPLLIDISASTTVVSSVEFPVERVDFARVIPHKRALLDAATSRFVPDERYRAFVAANATWLSDFALFIALKQAHHGAPWTEWAPAVAARHPAALDQWRRTLAAQIERVQREQYFFFAQFFALKKAATARGIRLMGDLPIYVAHDSADVWANRELFDLQDNGHPRVQAGVPPDYFSATGQLWGNPLYKWSTHHAENYAWWVKRMRASFRLFDVVRIDHFRGFESYWEVPGDATTAEHGRWVKGPGAALFDAVTTALGPLPIVAENLGVITEAVELLRESLGFPGMSILQFAFGGNGQPTDFTPHRLQRDNVVYTGTHDNDTTIGWWTSSGDTDSTRTDAEVALEKAYALRYLNADGREMHWTLIRAAFASVANTALVPMQDVLGLGSTARMNMPGRPTGNWGFRFTWDQLTPEILHRLRELIATYER